MKKIFFFILVLLSARSAMGQATSPQPAAQPQPALDGKAIGDKDEDNDDPYDSMTYFMYGINYLSNNVYLGRSDTMVIPYISPYIGYHLGFGLYAKAMVSYDPIRRNWYDPHVDVTTIEVGYDHTFGDHLNTTISLDKFFYDKNSINVRANSQGAGTVYGQYSNDWVEPQVIYMTTLNQKSMDYNTAFGLDHNFQFLNNTLNIIPTVTTYTGTQNYYDEYFKKRIEKKDKKVKEDKVISDAKKYKILDYEFSIQVTYRINKWLFSFTPTYAIPLSPSTIKLPTDTRKEKLTNKFFMELDICHR